MHFIIQSNDKKEPNWSGKEFSKLPCKIYGSVTSCADALEGYWFAENPLVKADHRQINIIPLTDVKMMLLTAQGKIRQ